MYADTDEVASSNPQCLGEATHLGPLGNINRVERVIATGESAHLDDQRSGLVPGEYVNFPAANADISGNDCEAIAEEEKRSEVFTDLTGRAAG
jgi:hypothetical protein